MTRTQCFQICLSIRKSGDDELSSCRLNACMLNTLRTTKLAGSARRCTPRPSALALAITLSLLFLSPGAAAMSAPGQAVPAAMQQKVQQLFKVSAGTGRMLTGACCLPKRWMPLSEQGHSPWLPADVPAEGR